MELTEATREQLIEEAKKKGYSPSKDAHVISNRDQLMSKNAELEEKLASKTATLEAVRTTNTELTSQIDISEKEWGKEKKKFETDITNFTEKYGDFEAVKTKLESFEANEAARVVKIEEDYNKITTDLDEKILSMIPEYDSKEKQLKWINDNLETLKIAKPKLDLDEGHSKDEEPIQQYVKEYAVSRGISEEYANIHYKEQAKTEYEKQR